MNPKHKILFVEDEATLAMIVKDMLEREGYDVVQASNGEEGLAAFGSNKIDAIIADIMMPKMDGFEMVRRIRKLDEDVPVLFLTAKSSIDDIVEGFEIGANDYLKKPFRSEELLVRLKALLRRRNNSHIEVLSIGQYRLNTSTQILSLGNKKHELTHIETVILRELALYKNQTVEARSLMLAVWQNDDPYNQNRLHGFIFKLRKYLASDPLVNIMNIRGIGYKLAIEED